VTVIAEWPVVVRDRIVHAFKPGGSPAAEGPFRTLRRHDWVSQGVRVTLFADRGLAGQMTFFSSLNVMAARLARRGNAPAAERVARAAADLEAGPEFAVLRRRLSELPDLEAEKVVSGLLPEDAPAALAQALRAVASRTEEVRVNDIILSSPAEVIFAGRIAEVSDDYVVVVQMRGSTTMVPRWMAVAAQRDRVGALLALVADKLDGASAVVEAVPAIAIDDASADDDFSPFGRGDARTRGITAEDTSLLAGEPQSLRILVPVTIDE
jgi:hypothetical protein